LTPTQQELKEKLEEEMNQTNTAWRGQAVKIDPTEDPVSDDHKKVVQAQGEANGCHTCLTKVSKDRDQPWIGDHIPPTNLASHVRALLPQANQNTTVLYPQCDTCAEKQSALVKRLNDLQGPALAAAYANLSLGERKLLCGGRTDRMYWTVSHGPTVTDAEGREVQRLGTRDGCHSCAPTRNMIPKSKYHADHSPPVLLNMPAVRKIMSRLGLQPPTTYWALPQCPRCSHGQGGALSDLRRRLKNEAPGLDVTTYW
jgi:hypothetical protein